MKSLLIPLAMLSFLLCVSRAAAETLDEALARCLAGETLTRGEIDGITDMLGGGAMIDGKRNSGSSYLRLAKRSIVDPVMQRGWMLRSDYVYDERAQATTYRELKALYEKDKSPLLAYALVCPAMFVNDFELLPELIAKIGENKHLKAHFDKVYASYWKPRLDPDF